MKKVKVCALAFLCISAATGRSFAGTAGGDWVPTHTRGISLRAPDLGRAPARRQLRISVATALRHRDQMDSFIAKLSTPGSAEFGKFLEPAQVMQRFGPTASDVQAVESYLHSQGFRGVSVASNRLLVDAVGSVAQVERAFHTRIEMFNLRGTIVHVNIDPAMVPRSLEGIAIAVLGLSNIPMHSPLEKAAVPPAPETNGFHPRAILHAYGAEQLKAATKTSIAIIASGDMNSTIDHLREAEKAEHFPKAPVSVVYTLPKEMLVNDNPLTGSLEWDLDAQISTMMAGAVKRLYIYDIATWDDPDVARGINAFVADDKAIALSASLGECDFLAFLDGAMITTDQSLQVGALQGQSAFASTGDNGYACPEVASTGLPEGPPGLSWPSDGEYTTGVGGTTLIADSAGNVSQELAWRGGGGGFSPWETAPPWTLHANPTGVSWQLLNQGGRAVPDVSAVADSRTGVLVYSGKATGPSRVGGTSVSSPLVMGLWARMEGLHGNNLGLAQYAFYRKYNQVNPGRSVGAAIVQLNAPQAPANPVSGFHDILLGTNGLYVATPGWDYTTGIGTLNTAVLSDELAK